MKRSSVGKSSSVQRRLDIRLDQHQSPRAMEHPQGKRPLHPRDLVVVQLHRVDHPAAVFVILGIGPENAGEQTWPGTPADAWGGAVREETVSCSLRQSSGGSTVFPQLPTSERVLRVTVPTRQRASVSPRWLPAFRVRREQKNRRRRIPGGIRPTSACSSTGPPGGTELPLSSHPMTSAQANSPAAFIDAIYQAD